MPASITVLTASDLVEEYAPRESVRNAMTAAVAGGGGASGGAASIGVSLARARLGIGTGDRTGTDRAGMVAG